MAILAPVDTGRKIPKRFFEGLERLDSATALMLATKRYNVRDRYRQRFGTTTRIPPTPRIAAKIAAAAPRPAGAGGGPGKNTPGGGSQRPIAIYDWPVPKQTPPPPPVDKVPKIPKLPPLPPPPLPQSVVPGAPEGTAVGGGGAPGGGILLIIGLALLASFGKGK